MRMFVGNRWKYTLGISTAVIAISILTFTFSIAYSQLATSEVDHGGSPGGFQQGIARYTLTYSDSNLFTTSDIPQGDLITGVVFWINDFGGDDTVRVQVYDAVTGSIIAEDIVTLPFFESTSPSKMVFSFATPFAMPADGIKVTLGWVSGGQVDVLASVSQGNGLYQGTNNGNTFPDLSIFQSGEQFSVGVQYMPSQADDTVPAVLGSISAPTSPVQINTQFTASDTFTDDSDDTHTASWNWGDSTTSTGTVTESGGSGSVQNTHTYTIPGVYTITLTVNNSDGTTATTQFQFVVTYDPNGAFVTGGGWINSPAGAYVSDTSLTGKATFGFNSKYQNGASTPTGNTEFNFKVANLNFHSTNYDWLVIAGAKAQYKGTGTINGAGSYHFMLTAIDGAINGGGGVDKFRLKITDSNNGLVYDNLLNAPDNSDPTTVLGGGDIIIHQN